MNFKILLLRFFTVVFVLFFQTLYSQENDAFEDLINEGMVLLNSKEIDASIPKFEDAIKINSSRVEGYYGLGVSYFNKCRQGDTLYCKEALVILERASNIDRDYKKLLYFSASTKILNKDLKGALSDLDDVIKQYPEDGYYLYNRAFLKYKMKKNDSACIDLNKSCQLGEKKSCEMLENVCE